MEIKKPVKLTYLSHPFATFENMFFFREIDCHVCRTIIYIDYENAIYSYLIKIARFEKVVGVKVDEKN